MDDFSDKILEISESLEAINDTSEEGKRKRLHELNSRLVKVSPELFADFLIEKGAKRNCLACGSSRISVHQSLMVDNDKLLSNDKLMELGLTAGMKAWSEATIYYVTFIKIDADKDLILSNLQYRTNCLNCGFISHYRTVTVLEWVESLESISRGKK